MRLHDIGTSFCTGMKISPRCGYRGELAPVWLASVQDFVLISCKRIQSHQRELEWTRTGMKVAPVSCKHPLRCTFAVIKRGRIEGQQIGFSLRENLSRNKPFPSLQHDLNKQELRARTVTHWKKTKFYVTHCVTYGFTGFQESGLCMKCSYFP